MLAEPYQAIAVAAAASAGTVLLIFLKSIQDFSRTGPQIRSEVVRHFRFYLVYALSRLCFWGWLICFFWCSLGATLYLGLISLAAVPFDGGTCGMAGLVVLGGATILNFSDQLLHKPSNICVSWQYRMSRLYGLWRLLSPGRIRLAKRITGGVTGALLAAGSLSTLLHGEWGRFSIHAVMLSLILGYFQWRRREMALPPPRPMNASNGKPNLVMIGSDTLRVDHIGAAGYHRPTTPFIDGLIRNGAFFKRCYTPLARTAPSLASLWTGVWPHQHRIRDNFVDKSLSNLPADTLPSVLRRHGYRSSAISDWCGSDLKKLGFGFDEVETPEDQWNLKYYLRQGPMLLRLFLSLFVNNSIGKRFLPEIFYQAGNPLESYLSVRACQKIHQFGSTGQPFFLNIFMASTHAPFGSEYPFYLRFSDRNYGGGSKFVMTSFRDPNEIIEKQELTPDKFDLDQIVRLYDGCVSKFDAEVARITGYLRDCGLAENTIVVVYSDHGIEFFENQSWGQGNTVLGDDHSARIPLLICDPRHPGGGVIEQVTRSVDIAPTLLELCGIEPPESMCGSSLVPILRERAEMDLMAYQETGIWLGKIPGLHPDHLTYPNLLDLLEIPDKKAGTLAIKPECLSMLNRAKDRMLRKGRWKLVYQPLRHGVLCQLFDMDNDSKCRRDVAAEYPEIFEKMKSELALWLRADDIDTADLGIDGTEGLRFQAWRGF
jgi:hypothetical protein